MRIAQNPILTAVFLFFSVGLVSTPPAVLAQADYILDAGSEISIEGTSTRSDWTVQATELDGSIGVAGEASDAEVSHGRLSIASAGIKSGKSTIMDRLMHSALMVDEHPEITYELTHAEQVGSAADDGTLTLNTTGEITLTGTTRDVQIEVTATPLEDGMIRFTGSHAMKMSDYGMAAPTAMFGQLRTADDITIHFDIVAAPTN